MALGMEIDLSPVHIVLDGDPAPPRKKGHSPPLFSPCLLCPNGWMDQDATWYEGRPRAGQHCVACGPSSILPIGTSAQFSVYVCCGQMALWIKMPLDMKGGLVPDHIVLHGDSAPPKRGTTHNFQPMSIVAKLWPFSATSELLYTFIA